MKEHPDYFNKVKEYDKERYTRKIINWYMAEMVDNPDINLLYHLAEVDFNDDDQVIKEYRERFEE